MATVQGSSTDPGVPGVRGDGTQSNGVLGESKATGHAGVAGVNDDGNGPGVFARSRVGRGVSGESAQGVGVHGRGPTGGHFEGGSGAGVHAVALGTGPAIRADGNIANAVRGISQAGDFQGAVVGINESDSLQAGAGVFGESNRGFGVRGESKQGAGVSGESVSVTGVFGSSAQATGVNGRGGPTGGHFEGGSVGVVGRSTQGTGVRGQGPTGGHFEGGSGAGVHAINLGNGAAVHAEARGTGAAIAAVGGTGGNHAGIFRGNVQVTGTIMTHDVFLTAADCAEDFDTMSSADIEPGTVMAIGDDARLVESDRAYDKRVAGIVSGAGDYKPGIVLGKDDSRKDRVPLALVGRVFCKTDAIYAPIEVGDLLTTSPTQGHAMKAEDPLKAFGAVIGKALAPLREGRGLLPILVALQ